MRARMRHPMDLVNEPWLRLALRGRLLAPWRRRRFHEFGSGSVIHRPLAIYGPWQMAVGANVVVFHGAWLAVERQAWELPAPVLRIGDHVGLRPFCTISAAESIVIEDHAMIGSYTSIIDSDHLQVPGSDNITWNPLETTPTRIGHGTWVGERCAILRGADIGRHCIIGTNSVVRGKIPDYSLAVGAPARVVRRLDAFEGR